MNDVDRYTDDIASVSFDHKASQSPDSLGLGSERLALFKDGKPLVQRIVALSKPDSFAYFTDMNKSKVSVPIQYSVAHYALKKQKTGRL